MRFSHFGITKTLNRRKGISAALGLGIVLWTVGFAAEDLLAYGQPLTGFQTDAVYLLDVTSSTIGRGPGSRDILNELIDLLLADIDRFPGGRFVLITFANGPYDLDGAGPIQAIYRLNIESEQDKLYLKRFLRPQQYGPFSDDPKWPGVYEAVKRHRRGIFPTGIYSTILQAVRILEEFQQEGGSDYKRTHLQEIVVYTDGRNNAPFSPSFEDVIAKLQERNFAMVQRFRYKRYLFSPNPHDIQQAQEECTLIEKRGLGDSVHNVIAPDIEKLIVIDFDRGILGFPNLWSPSGIEADSWTVTLKDIHVYHEAEHLEILQGGRLRIQPVRAGDFGLPEDIAVRVSTTPAVLRFPLESFDLSLTFEPFSRLEAYMREKSLERLRGVLHVAFEKEGFRSEKGKACSLSEEGKILVDVRAAYLPVDVPFRRPRLTVEAQREDFDRIRLTLLPDETYAGLPEKQRVVKVRLLPPDLLLGTQDDAGNAVSLAHPIPLSAGLRTLFLRIGKSSSGACDTPIPFEVQVTSPVPGIVLNKRIRPSISFSFEEGRAQFTSREWVSPNLWSAKHWLPGDRTPIELPLPLEVCSSHAGTLTLQVDTASSVRLPATFQIEPSTLKIRGQRETFTVKLRIEPLEDWETLGQLLQEEGPHLRLKALYAVDSPKVLSLAPDPLTIRLVYEPHFLSLRVNPLVNPNAEISPGTEAFEWVVEGPSGTALLVRGLPIWDVESIAPSGKRTQTVPSSQGEWRLPVPGRYRFRLDPNLPRSDQEGALEIQVEGNLPLQVLQEEREERRPEGTYRLSYRFHVVAPLITVVCQEPAQTEEGRNRRYRRGQMVLNCTPSGQYLSEEQWGQIQLRITCPEGLVLIISKERGIPCESGRQETLALEPFQVQLGSKTPAGRLGPLLQSLSIAAIYEGRALETTLDVEPAQGYLFPRIYDTFWQPFLFWFGIALSALPFIVIIILSGYAFFYERENPLYLLIDLADRWKGVLLGYAIVLASFWLVQGLVYGILQWRYGSG